MLETPVRDLVKLYRWVTASLFVLWLYCSFQPGASAQEPDKLQLRSSIATSDPAIKLTLSGAVQVATKKYPTMRKRDSQTSASKAQITEARTQYLPRMDLLFQELRASQNVTAGTILPQFLNVIPIQSGAPANSSNMKSIWGSNAGLNFSWELVDFGRRAANVNVAKKGLGQSMAQDSLTELDVSFRASACYLKLLAAQQQIVACKATLDRMQDWAMIVHTLCDKGLRPGVDAYRADSEVSMAKIALIEANKLSDFAQQDLSEAIGMAGAPVEAIATPFIARRSDINQQVAPRLNQKALERHPMAVLRMSEVDVSKARLHLLDRTWYPHLWLESAIWGRGSGAPRFISPVASGIVPKTANYAVGFTLQFPLMQYFKVRADKAVERAELEERRANYDLAMQELIREDGKAQIFLRRTQEMADETPVLVTAARETELKAKERYRVGLTNVIEVADAERLLARAETENAVAQINVWQAQLATAYAHGDIQPFMKLVALAETGQ